MKIEYDDVVISPDMSLHVSLVYLTNISPEFFWITCDVLTCMRVCGFLR
jgi:hypothetical protein